ncbi:hypothetical protein BASA50_001135 [Batrachochytrium salamandrivorans]|uniref:Uncharacterized protein n=1 Tax=Batrachochytrium salamandrivorans TaxID=1357716 RepID=A0ABQ8ESS2_9FUNG|nr:hypothetical protein BASA50_001135 [Batrachochytrium salamandrivorans]
MKVKALVVAAMVITSVNAGWRRRFKDLFGGNGGKPRSVFPQDLSMNEWSMSQDTEPTKKESADDSNMNGIGKNLICDFLISIAEDLHRNIFGNVDEYRSHLSVLYTLQGKAENLKEEEKEDHSASFEHVNGRLQAIKGEFTSLKDRYLEMLKQLVRNECMTESVHLTSPEDMERIDIFLDELLNLRESTRKDKEGVIVFHREWVDGHEKIVIHKDVHNF